MLPQFEAANGVTVATMNGAALVGRGEAEIGLQQVSEMLPIPNTTFVGTLPADIQDVTTDAGGIGAGSANASTASKLLAFLSSPAGAAAPRVRKPAATVVQGPVTGDPGSIDGGAV